MEVNRVYPALDYEKYKRCFGIEISVDNYVCSGCYSQIYKINYCNRVAILKRYFEKGFAKAEYDSMLFLIEKKVFPMPELYGFNFSEGIYSDEQFPDEFLVMEYIYGNTLASIKYPSDKLCNHVVGLLHKLHSFENSYFGTKQQSYASWKEQYFLTISHLYGECCKLYQENAISKEHMNLMEHSLGIVGDVMEETIAPRALHGDFTPWNVMITSDADCKVVILDPFHSHWGDSDLDLIQLNKANGQKLQLLQRYEMLQGSCPSELYLKKMSTYTFWNETAHNIHSQRHNRNSMDEYCSKYKYVFGL
jgi:tRNA A-37 threonylcarbamoyl transferase component Bud32